jgi:polygalacturonase
MNRRIFFALTLSAMTAADATEPAKAADGWQLVPQILQRLQPPVFPARDFCVTNFGALGDGVTDCTKSFADAIAACQQAGGGRVTVPPGKFLSGAIHLLSGVNLHVEKDATILFSPDPEKFLPVVFSRDVSEMMNYSPFIYAFEQTNIAVTGEGTLDGQASKSVWPGFVAKSKPDADRLIAMGDQEVPVAQRVLGRGHFIRPNFIEPVRCRNVLLEGVRVVDSPMWEIHPLYCTNVTVRGVSISSHGKNNDGCDPDSCTDVLIKDCVFDTGDDCIAVKAGRDHDGRRVNIPCQNVVIQNCEFKDGHGGVTLGSETAGGLKNVFAENCRFDSRNLDMAMRFKTDATRGGFIENIFIRHCTVDTARTGIHMTLKYSKGVTGNFIPRVGHIDIRDCEFHALTRQGIFIEGLANGKISDVTIANCAFESPEAANVITNAVRVKLEADHFLKR